MKLPRRRFLRLTAGALAMPAVATPAMALDYPTRSVRIIVGYAAGGVSDILARLIAQALSDRLGQPFVVEDRPGAGSNIATEMVVRAPPDGYTLLLVGVVNAINVALYKDLTFKFVHDIAPVALMSRSPLVMEVNPSIPAESIPELIAYAKSHPGMINMGSAGIGGATHVGGELFQMMTGVKFTHVPYNGSPPAITDLLAGRVQIMFDNMAPSLPFIRAGKLRALGVSSPVRSPALPDVPSISEFVPGYEADVWNGIGAPRNCPADVIDKLNGTINAAVSDTKVKAAIAALGNTPLTSSPVDFGKLIVDDTDKWAQVLKFAGIKPQ